MDLIKPNQEKCSIKKEISMKVNLLLMEEERSVISITKEVCCKMMFGLCSLFDCWCMYVGYLD